MSQEATELSTRLLYFIGIVVLIAAVFAYRLEHRPLTSTSNITDGLAFSAANTQLSVIGDHANVSMSVQAEQLSSRLGSEQYDLNQLNASLYGQKDASVTRISAPQARYGSLDQQLDLLGDVKVMRLEGANKDSLLAPRSEMFTRGLSANLQTNTLVSQSPIELILPSGSLRVQSLQADLDTGIYEFDSVSAQFSP